MVKTFDIYNLSMYYLKYLRSPPIICKDIKLENEILKRIMSSLGGNFLDTVMQFYIPCLNNELK